MHKHTHPPPQEENPCAVIYADNDPDDDSDQYSKARKASWWAMLSEHITSALMSLSPSSRDRMEVKELAHILACLYVVDGRQLADGGPCVCTYKPFNNTHIHT